ncbi:MAG: hypothetical protein RI990_281 [Planctomycetota bacterium]|jgi:hypothetical protein
MLESIDQWITHLTGLAGPGTCPDPTELPPTTLPPGSPDTVLWRAATAPDDAAALELADRLLAARPGQSLVDAGTFLALEVWTESELGALHALARVVRRAPTPARAHRLDELRRWHLEHTQPDNATNRPWAIHVFLRSPDPESWLYAETLLHNVHASDARGEGLSRWILRDTLRELRAAAP